MIPTDLAPASPRPAAPARAETATRPDEKGAGDTFARLLEHEDRAGDPAAPSASPADPGTAEQDAGAIPSVSAVKDADAGLAMDAEQADAAALPAVPMLDVATLAASEGIAAPLAGRPVLDAEAAADGRPASRTVVERADPRADATPAAGPLQAAAPVGAHRPAPGAAGPSGEDAAAETAPADPEPALPRAASTAPATATPPPPTPAVQPPATTGAEAEAFLGTASGRLDAAHDPARLVSLAPRGAALAQAPREVAGQITLAIAQATQPQVELRLDPPELGRVSIRLTPVQGGLEAMVLAERPETQDFLRRHADVLQRDLDAAGYESVSLDFATGHGGDPRDMPAETVLTPVILAGTEPEPAAFRAAQTPPRSPITGALDIRL